MKRFLPAIVACCGIALASTLAYASLYGWNNLKRPPISLADALTCAEVHLGEDAKNRYCVGATLYGDRRNDGTRGKWNLCFAAADGSVKNVTCDMQGNVDVSVHTPSAEQLRALATVDLDDLQHRLGEILARHKVDAKVVVEEGVLKIRHRTRTFQIHLPDEKAGFSEDARTVTGPAHDGFWLEARLVEEIDRSFRDYGAEPGEYWRTQSGTYYTKTEGRYLAVDLRFGRGLDEKLAQDLGNAFGIITQ
ncbi:MAG: hypothetical protein QM811_21380 [Pirellulales bacterium]